MSDRGEGEPQAAQAPLAAEAAAAAEAPEAAEAPKAEVPEAVAPKATVAPEAAEAPVPHCRHCGERIGAYEPLVLVAQGTARISSIAAEPWLAEAAAGDAYHLDCYSVLRGELPGADTAASELPGADTAAK